MKQKIFILFLIFVTNWAESQEVKGLDSYINWSGEYRLRGLYLDNFQNGSDSIDSYTHRFLFGGKFAPSDSLEANFKLNLYDQLGGEKKGDFGLLQDGGKDFQAQLLTAYGDWNLGSGFYLHFGRLGLSWGNETLVSQNEDDLRPYSYDGLLLGYDAKSFRFEGGVLKLGDWSSAKGDIVDPDETSYFFHLKMKSFSSFIESLNVFFFRVQADNYINTAINVNQPGQSINKLGGSIKGGLSGWFYDLDYVNQSGSSNTGLSIAGWMAHMKLGFNLSKAGDTSLFFIFHSDTGDDEGTAQTNETYQPLYYNHFKYAGLMNLFGWGNLRYYGLGLDYKLSHKTALQAQVLRLNLSTAESGPSAISSRGFEEGGSFIDSGVHANSASVADKSLGTELDLKLLRTFSSRAYLEFIAGVFLPTDYFKAYNRDKTLYSFRLSLGFDF